MGNAIFYICINDYVSTDLAGAAIYFFLKKNILFDHNLVVYHDGISEDEKKFLVSLYHNTRFQEIDEHLSFQGTKLSDYDWALLPEIIQGNTPLLEEYNNWKVRYNFNEEVSFPKHAEDADKYIALTCAKNENDYIVEWIEHYLGLGFDKIIICDNNDDNSLDEIVADFVSRGTVEIFDCHGMTCFQERMFQMFCEEGNYKWCAYFDCDEFLELGVHSNIKEYLETKKEDCVAFNWVIFGPDGQLDKKPGKVSERFRVPYLPLLNIYNGFLKGILRGGRFKFRNVRFSGGHLPYPMDEEVQNNTYNIGGYYLCDSAPYQTGYPLRYKEGYIKHYYTKSFEEWLDKAKRGWPLNTESLPLYRYFSLESREKITRAQHEKDIFLNDEWFIFRTTTLMEFLKTHNIIELANEKCSAYGFVSMVLYIMSQVTGKIIFIKSKKVDDFLFAILLENAFATGNRVIYCKDDGEINKAFLKYRANNDDVYLWEVF